MAVGRNWVVRRSLIQPQDYATHRAYLSGDDDLTLQRLVRKGRFVPVLAPQSQTTTRLPDSFRNWFHQKARHVSASLAYPLPVKIGLGLYHSSLAAFWVSLGILPFSTLPIWIFLFPFFTLIIRLLVGNQLLRCLQLETISSFLPILELSIFLYTTLLVPAGWFLNPVWTPQNRKFRKVPKKISS
jgi:hypothetical protein